VTSTDGAPNGDADILRHEEIVERIRKGQKTLSEIEANARDAEHKRLDAIATTKNRFDEEVTVFRGKTSVFLARVRHESIKICVYLLICTPLIILSNVVADAPGRGSTPVLGFINTAWDGIYEAVKDGLGI
jgi:hypothetical protein